MNWTLFWSSFAGAGSSTLIVVSLGIGAIILYSRALERTSNEDKPYIAPALALPHGYAWLLPTNDPFLYEHADDYQRALGRGVHVAYRITEQGDPETQPHAIRILFHCRSGRWSAYPSRCYHTGKHPTHCATTEITARERLSFLHLATLLPAKSNEDIYTIGYSYLPAFPATVST